MNKKLTLPQTILITLTCIAMVLAIFDVPGLAMLTPVVSAMFVVITMMSDSKGIFVSVVMVVLALIFFINPVYIFDVSLNCIMPSIVMGIIFKKALENNENKYEPIFSGIIAFILGIIANYVLLKYLFNVDMIKQFTDMLKDSLAGQMNLVQEIAGGDVELTEKALIESTLNMMPIILFSRAMILAIVNYFLAIFMLKRMMKVDLGEIKFSKIYLPGNAVMISFIAYVLILLLELVKAPLNTNLILLNVQAIFYILFFLQGISLLIFYLKKWLKEKSFMKFSLAFVSMGLFGIFGISLIGMVDTIFDFRKVKIAN